MELDDVILDLDGIDFGEDIHIIQDYDIEEALDSLNLKNDNEYLNIAKRYIDFYEITRLVLHYEDLDEQSLAIVNKIIRSLDKKMFDKNKPYIVRESKDSNLKLNEEIFVSGYFLTKLNNNIIKGNFFEESGFIYKCFNKDNIWEAYKTAYYGSEPKLYKKYNSLEEAVIECENSSVQDSVSPQIVPELQS